MAGRELLNWLGLPGFGIVIYGTTFEVVGRSAPVVVRKLRSRHVAARAAGNGFPYCRLPDDEMFGIPAESEYRRTSSAALIMRVRCARLQKSYHLPLDVAHSLEA